MSSFNRYLFVCEEWLSVECEDGKTSRTLKVSTMDSEVNSGLLFRHNINRKLFDDHLWLSVVFRNSRSRFTRKQRLSVCMALLYLTMITNAMWYQTGGKSSSGIFSFGPITIAVTELLNSVWSSLIVIPPIMFITAIFTNLKHKEPCAGSKDQKSSSMPSNPPDENWRPPKKTFRFPYWCLYIAWVLVALSILTSGFFIILYSFQWGGDKTNSWLVAFFLSFFESVVLVQPAKVTAKRKLINTFIIVYILIVTMISQ